MGKWLASASYVEVRRLGCTWRALLYWLTLAVILCAIKSPHVMESDEGLVLEGAWNLLNHRELYTDSFQIVTPGAFYAVYWAWRVFGAEYEVAQLLGIAAILLTAVGLYRTSTILASTSIFTYVGPALYVLASSTWPAINHNSFNAALLSWALYFAVRGVQARSLRSSVVAGLLTGLAIMTMQNKGAAMLVAVAGFHACRYVFTSDRHSRSALLLYGLAAMIPALLLLAWPLPVLFESLIEYPLLRYRNVNQVPLGPLAIAAAYFVLAYRLVDTGSRGVQLLLTVQALLLATTWQRTDLAHTFIVSFPLLALIPAMRPGFMQLKRASRAVRYAYAGAAIACVTYVASFAVMQTSLAWRLAGLGGGIMTYVRERCASIYAGPFMPGVYYEARKINPTSYPYLLTGFNSEAQFEDAKAQLAGAMPECIVANYGMVMRFAYDRDNPVDRYIEERYVPAFAEAGVTVYVQRGSRAALGAASAAH